MPLEKVWRDMLATKIPADTIARPDEIDEVVSIMTASRIDPRLFAANLMRILKQHIPFGNLKARTPDSESTPSLIKIGDLKNPPMNAPLWMLAAVPDVLLWLRNVMQKLDPNKELDDMPPEILRFHGINPADLDTIKEVEAFNPDGRFRPKFYAKLIESYLAATGRPLEASVSRNTASDIYVGSDLFNRLGVEDNFALIAKMTTMYYRQLKMKYSHRFPGEMALIATAGALDAQIYINKTKEITLEQVKQLAHTASIATSPLLEFIIMLETLMLTVDTPQYSSDEVEKAVRGNTQRIEQAVEATKQTGEIAPMVVRAVDDFMNKRRNRKLWMLLGVSNT